MKNNRFCLPQSAISFYKNFYQMKEADEYFLLLKNNLCWQEKEITLFGKKMLQPRLVTFYGDNNICYQYSGQVMESLAWNKQLLEIKDKLQDQLGLRFNSCLCNFYRNGNDSMGWHQDNEKELGRNPTIASLSFGGPRVFKLKHLTEKDYKQDVVLTAGSLLIMSGETQHYYKHAIPKTKKPVASRINLTFRTVLT